MPNGDTTEKNWKPDTGQHWSRLDDESDPPKDMIYTGDTISGWASDRFTLVDPLWTSADTTLARGRVRIIDGECSIHRYRMMVYNGEYYYLSYTWYIEGLPAELADWHNCNNYWGDIPWDEQGLDDAELRVQGWWNQNSQGSWIQLEEASVSVFR